MFYSSGQIRKKKLDLLRCCFGLLTPNSQHRQSVAKTSLCLCVKPVCVKNNLNMRSLAPSLQRFTIAVITLGALAFPSRRILITPPLWEKLYRLKKLSLHLIHWSTPSAKHHGSSYAKYTAHVLPWSRLATHTILSSQSFNFHHRLRVQALRSPASAGLPDYSDEQF